MFSLGRLACRWEVWEITGKFEYVFPEQTRMSVGSLSDNWKVNFLTSDTDDIRQLADRFESLAEYEPHYQYVIIIFFIKIGIWFILNHLR